jgi:hypothetical protein
VFCGVFNVPYLACLQVTSFMMSVFPCACNRVIPTGWIFMKFCVWDCTKIRWWSPVLFKTGQK